MTVIDADVHGASQLFPDVENEPKVADDALIDVSNRTDVLFCLFSANIDDADGKPDVNKEDLMSRTSSMLPTTP